MFNEKEQYLLDEWVMKTYDQRIGFKTTVVCLILANGYEVVGTSACINPMDYDYEEGVFFATKDALQRVKDIVGYLEQNDFKE